MPKKKAKAAHKLILFDHDGTLCETNPMAYDSMKSAFHTTLESLKLKTDVEIDWERTFAETAGTTEKNLVRYVSYVHSVPPQLIPDFENKYYKFRAKWFQTMRESGEYVWDSYYPDAHQLAYECARRRNFHGWLLTGNPEIVVEERLTNSLRDIFLGKDGKIKGVFGNEALTRQDLLTKAIQKAEQAFGKSILDTNSKGFYKHIYYIADSRNDFFAGLEAKIKAVWIPSRKLQSLVDIKNQDYVKFITKMLGNNILITNDLSSKEVYDYILKEE